MTGRVSSSLLLLLTAVGLASLAGCGVPSRPQRPAWRAFAEQVCIAQKRVRPSAYVQVASELDGPGICGLTAPFKVTALQGGAVSFNATATLDCPMVAELDEWLRDVVQPAAQARFGQNVAQINSMGSYACRGVNNQRGAPLSEHSFGNALDIGGFVLADGRAITLVRDWWQGDEQARAFLMDVHGGSCQHFSTVLSPGSNTFHYNHIHVDLAVHGRNGKHVCKPVPHEIAAPPSTEPSALIASRERQSEGVVDDDSDTGERPPHAAFEGEGVGAREGLGPLAAPMPPRRNPELRGQPEADDGDATSSIVKSRR
jgi:hypothetical protein